MRSPLPPTKNRLRSPHPRPPANRIIPRTFRSNFLSPRMLWPCKQFILDPTVYRHCVCTEQQMHDYFMYINLQTGVILLQNVKFSLLYLISFQTTWIELNNYIEHKYITFVLVNWRIYVSFKFFRSKVKIYCMSCHNLSFQIEKLVNCKFHKYLSNGLPVVRIHWRTALQTCKQQQPRHRPRSTLGSMF